MALQAQRATTLEEQKKYGVKPTLSFDVAEGQEAADYKKAGYNIVGAPVITSSNARSDLSLKQGALNKAEKDIVSQAEANKRAKIAKQEADAQKKAQEEANRLKQQEIDAKNKLGSDLAKATGNTQIDNILYEQKKLDQEADDEYKKYTEQIESIQNGTFPLSPYEQRQIDDVVNKFNQLKEEQKQYNQNYKSGITQLELTSGRARYAGQLSEGNIKNAVDQGVAKIAEIDAAAASAVNSLRIALQEQNYKRISAAYDAYNQNLQRKTKALEEMKATINEEAERQRKAIQDDIAVQKDLQSIIKDNVDLYSSSLINFGADGLSLVDDADIEAYASQIGVPSQVLKSQARAKMYELSKLSQEEMKRELDIAKAEQDLIPELYQEYDEAVRRGEWNKEDGNVLDFLRSKEAAKETSTVRSEKVLSPSEIKNLREQGYDVTYGMTESDVIAQGAPITKYNAKQEKIINDINEKIPTKSSAYKSVVEMKGFVDNVLNALNAENGLADITAINQFQKVIDAGAVTRDKDVELIQKSQSLFNSLKTRIKKLEKGDQLGDDQRQQMRELMQALYDGKIKDIKKDPYIQSRVSEAERSGVDLADTIIGELDGFLERKSTYDNVNDFYKNASDSEINEFDSIRSLLPKDLNPQEVYDFYLEESGKSKPLSMGVKGSTDVSKIKDGSRVTTSLGEGIATGIVKGSKFWSNGFDFVLPGGKKAKVKTPFAGEVTQAKNDGAWGNSVKIKMPNGETIRLSHLDKINVKPGQKITAESIIGTQGNTGKTYGKTGIHVDITMYDKNGKPYTSQQVASFLNTKLL